MQHPIDAPTPQALADLVARCREIDRYATQLTNAEESRIAALASALLSMRRVLELERIPEGKLPARQSRIDHWLLTGGTLETLETPAIRALPGVLALDEHEQIKVLTSHHWRGGWRTVTLWRDGVARLAAHDLMEYLAALVAHAQKTAPSVASALLERSRAIAGTDALTGNMPRARND
jgi:hypothetical protein